MSDTRFQTSKSAKVISHRDFSGGIRDTSEERGELRFSPLSRLSKRIINKLSNNSHNSNSNSNRLLVIIVPP